MRQVFKLMDMPDRVIAFDSLPEELLAGIELVDCSKLNKEWREFVGYREKKTIIRPEMDPITKQYNKAEPLIEKKPFAYLIDRELNADKDRWAEILTYVRRHAPMSWTQSNGHPQRLMDDIEKMAKPIARDVHSDPDLEVEDVIVIPLNGLAVPKEPEAAAVTTAPAPVPAAPASPAPQPLTEHGYPETFKIIPPKPQFAKQEPICVICNKVFSSRQAVRMHTMKKHADAIPAEPTEAK